MSGLSKKYIVLGAFCTLPAIVVGGESDAENDISISEKAINLCKDIQCMHVEKKVDTTRRMSSSFEKIKNQPKLKLKMQKSQPNH